MLYACISVFHFFFLSQDTIVNFWFGTQFKAMYLPWVLFAFNLIISGRILYLRQEKKSRRQSSGSGSVIICADPGLVPGTDPSIPINKQNFYSFVTYFITCYLRGLKKMYSTYFWLTSWKPLKKKKWSGSVNQGYGSSDPRIRMKS